MKIRINSNKDLLLPFDNVQAFCRILELDALKKKKKLSIHSYGI